MIWQLFEKILGGTLYETKSFFFFFYFGTIPLVLLVEHSSRGFPLPNRFAYFSFFMSILTQKRLHKT